MFQALSLEPELQTYKRVRQSHMPFGVYGLTGGEGGPVR